MKLDTGLAPTRRIRKAISHEHDNDPRRLVEYYMEYQRRFGDRLRWAVGADAVGAAEKSARPAGAANRRD